TINAHCCLTYISLLHTSSRTTEFYTLSLHDALPISRGIDKGQDRHLETLGHFHQAQGLAVTFRARHAEVTLDLVTYFAAFLVTEDRKSTRLNSSHVKISYAVFCLKKKINHIYLLFFS